MKESAKMATIKFHQLEDFTAPGPCPMGKRTQTDREIQGERALGRGNRWEKEEDL